jgi:glycosyltransferase involved in cell wall biosynthesis
VTARVLLIPDEPHWALDKNAQDLVRYNTTAMQLDICYFSDFMQSHGHYYQTYDLLFPMYMGLFFTMLKQGLPTDKVVTGVRSFHRWDRGRTRPPGYNTRPPVRVIRRLRKALLVNTHCRKLWRIFSRYLPVVHTKYTCDLDIFYPDRSRRRSEALTVGWAGSLSNHPGKRGFHDLIKPVCDAVPGVVLRTRIREHEFVTDDNQMREFYNSLDLYVCASRSEGTPRPLLEAAACGIPVLTTDVGIVPELIEEGINGFVVERTAEAFRAKLMWLKENRDALTSMGVAARRKMEREFRWELLVGQWTDFFASALERRHLMRSGHVR